MHRELERPFVDRKGCSKLATKSTHGSGSHDAPISYCDAIRREMIIAEQHRRGVTFNAPTKMREQVVHDGHNAGALYPRRRATAGQHTGCVQTVPLADALGKLAAHSIKAPHSTPSDDTSAMDGFAVCSRSTVSASPEHPVTLRVVGVVAAGDQTEPEQDLACLVGDRIKNGIDVPTMCVEIMTGAKFPERTFPELDAVIKVEDVVVVRDATEPGQTYIDIGAPVRAGQNRRYAGSDIAAGNVIVSAGERIESKHIMALASVGFSRIEVAKEQHAAPLDLNFHALEEAWKIGVLSTGSELVDLSSTQDSADFKIVEGKLPDSNGPYVCSALREMDPSYEVEHLGVVEDRESALEQSIRRAVQERCVDVLITTGGVSMGKFDLVRPVVEKRLGGRVIFHGVKVRPGLPVFFAWLEMSSIDKAPQRPSYTAFFGLPGNPLAAAMALRFFVVPYLANLHGTAVPISPSRCIAFFGPGRSMSSGLANGEQCCDNQGRSRKKPEHLRAFWLAKLCSHGKGQDPVDCVEILEDQSSYKVGNLVRTNCWVEIPEGVNAVVEGDRVTVHPFVPMAYL